MRKHRLSTVKDEANNEASEAAATLARLRAKALSPERRQEIARDAANARWGSGTSKSQARRRKPSKS
jgi:hypothetical protein